MNKAVKKIQKSTLLNIDSMFRNLYPKNIYYTNGMTLPSDPFVFTKGSSIININYPNHNLLTGDNIVIQNVNGISKSLINSIYLINGFNYYVIIFGSNMIDIDYRNNTTELYATIEAENQTDTNIFNNICFNDIVGYKQIFVGSDIPQRLLTAIYPTIQSIVGSNIITNTTTFTNYINSNCLFVPLPTNYINITVNYYQIKQIFKITYQHIAGIKLGYLNSNYPISNINYQANQAVYNVIDSDNFMINLNYNAYGNYSGGGKNVQIMKIIDSIPGYPSANNYVINLKKSFNNVTKIELVGSEIPYVDIIIQKNVNDKLYWKHIQDGNTVYMLQIDEGFYSTTTLLNKIQTEINKVPRKVTTSIGTIYNNFDVNLETNINKITFTPYINTNVPNSLNVRSGPINGVLYYFLTINMHQSFVQIGDVITISKATDVTLVSDNSITIIGSNYLNKEFTIYAINPENNTFDVVIGMVSSVTTSIGTITLNGGKDIIVKTKTKVSFLFDRKDTMGDILGFMNVGVKGSIIDFDYEQTNKKQYIASTNTDYVGNIINYSNGFINLSGKYTYILMYMNDIEYVHSTSNLASAFAKIQLNGNPGDLLFNTYVENPENIYSKSFPISNLTQLTISFTYPDGTPIEFRNVNHSFTLRIVEEHNETNDINLNSQNITFVDEMKKTVKE